MKHYYFHGFGSGPDAAKRKAMETVLGPGSVSSPDFNIPPKNVKNLLDGLAASIKNDGPARTMITGSSLGGLYALYVSALSGCRCLLLNPCFFPLAVIDKTDARVSRGDLAAALRIASDAYENYDAALVRVWIASGDTLIDHSKYTKPFFYDPPSEYTVFPEELAKGHEFAGFGALFADRFAPDKK